MTLSYYLLARCKSSSAFVSRKCSPIKWLHEPLQVGNLCNLTVNDVAEICNLWPRHKMTHKAQHRLYLWPVAVQERPKEQNIQALCTLVLGGLHPEEECQLEMVIQGWSGSKKLLSSSKDSIYCPICQPLCCLGFLLFGRCCRFQQGITGVYGIGCAEDQAAEITT